MFPSSRCGPRLSEAAAEKLKNRYVLMRSGVREHEMESEKRLNIPITVRYVATRLALTVCVLVMIPIKLKALSDLVTHNRGQLIYDSIV